MTEKQDKFRLTSEGIKKVDDFFKEKVPNPTCPMCGHNVFTPADYLVNLNIATLGGSVRLGGVKYPLIMATCNNCFYVAFHAADPIGITRKSEHNGGGG